VARKTSRRLLFLVVGIVAIIALPIVVLALVLLSVQPHLSARAAPALPPPELWSGWTYEDTYPLYVDQPVALLDQPVTIRVEKLKSNQPLTLRLSTLDPKTQLVWESFATFEADDQGVIDLASSQPLYGTYKGIDSMGLFWSMLPVGAADPESTSLYIGPQGLTLILTAESGTSKLATTTLTRLLHTELTEQVVRDDGLAGTFFYPKSAGRYPAVIMLGGSGGGLDESTAQLLASHGYATLALAYFRYDSLPPDLEEIPLEYFGKAIAWLKNQPVIEPGQIAINGGSRGTEAVLLAAAYYPTDVKAVIAWMPSAVAWQADSIGGYLQGRPAWTFEGKPIPALKQALTPDIIGTFLRIGGPYQNKTAYEPALADPAAVAAAAIPVENIEGPILLISGKDDQLWPSGRMADMIMARLKAKNHPFADLNLSYEGAGHWVGVPYLPAVSSTRNRVYLAGGTMEANAAASSDSWSKMLAFLDQQLRGK
jgi:dienelactone hydrolase